MSDKQQSAVDWLFEQLTEVDYNCINKTFLQNNNSMAGYKLRELFDQAKELFKQQIDDSHIQGMYKGQSIYFSDDKIKLDVNHLDYCLNESEQYFNQTFKTE